MHPIIPHIYSSVGYWVSFICITVCHNLLRDKRNRLHTFFLPQFQHPVPTGSILLIMDRMKAIIADFIRRGIPAGHIFDAHTVIDYLILNHSDEYHSYRYADETTEHFHSRISKLIDSFDSSLITRLDRNSLSKNIRDNFTTNTCWLKN